MRSCLRPKEARRWPRLLSPGRDRRCPQSQSLQDPSREPRIDQIPMPESHLPRHAAEGEGGRDRRCPSTGRRPGSAELGRQRAEESPRAAGFGPRSKPRARRMRPNRAHHGSSARADHLITRGDRGDQPGEARADHPASDRSRDEGQSCGPTPRGGTRGRTSVVRSAGTGGDHMAPRR